jgi:hypothetical protein
MKFELLFEGRRMSGRYSWRICTLLLTCLYHVLYIYVCVCVCVCNLYVCLKIAVGYQKEFMKSGSYRLFYCTISLLIMLCINLLLYVWSMNLFFLQGFIFQPDWVKKSSAFWAFSSPLKVSQCFGGTCHLHLQSEWFIAWLIFHPWRWRQHVLLNLGWLSADSMLLYSRSSDSS